MICVFLSMECDEARLSALSASRGKDGRTMIADASGDDANVTISAFVG